MTAREALGEATATLDRAGVPSPDVDAEWLLAHVLGISRSELHSATVDGELEEFRSLVERRAQREPLAYILGEWGFRRLTLAVDPRVLIPRPETEAVVDRCLALLEPAEQPTVLDIGVGSGAIALAIADEHSGAHVVGTDTSEGALEVAEANRERAGVGARVRFVHGDLTAGEAGPFDLVVSNPPYVAPEELAELEPELRHEPAEALVGVGRHRTVASAALEVLRQGGALVLEVGDNQACDVAPVLVALGYRDVRVTNDLAGRERIIEGRRP